MSAQQDLLIAMLNVQHQNRRIELRWTFYICDLRQPKRLDIVEDEQRRSLERKYYIFIEIVEQ